MANRKSQKARLGFESLERRDTPGSLAGGAELAAVAARAAVSAAATTSVFRGAGRVAVTRQTTLPNRLIQVVGNVAGTATVIGKFTGTSVTVFTANLKSFRSAVVLQATDGSKLVLSITGTKGVGNTLTGRYTITGGNGRLAHSTGAGTVTGGLALATKSLTFNFNGTIRKP